MKDIDLNEVRNEIARRHLLDFTKHTMPEFEAEKFHEVYYEVLDRFAKGKIKKLMVTMPPQHGKSEGSTRRLPAFMLGRNPDLRIAIASYTSTFAKKFNRDIQRIVDDQVYNDLFPETYLNSSNVVEGVNNYIRTADEFEIVDKKGSLKAVGRGGPLTGNPVDIMIMDDLFKDHSEGNSPTVRQAVWDWYTTTVQTRMHNDSQELIVFTRWNEDDLIGRIEKKENVIEVHSFEQLESIDPDSWVKINFEAIKDSVKTEFDQREKGLALWEKKHSIKKLTKTKNLDTENFNCLYQGNPESKEGMLYDEFGTYQVKPRFNEIKNYTDTADTGIDCLCSINYALPQNEGNDKIYILDLIYTDAPMEVTEPATAALLKRSDVGLAEIESNNGGRGFGRAVEKLISNNCVVDMFHQSANKESRIHTNKAAVNKRIVFPHDWQIRFPEFYDHITRYKKLFKANTQDGGPDVLSGIVERNEGGEIWVL